MKRKKMETNVPNIRTNYSVTEKADGERRLLFINSEGYIYLIDTNMSFMFTGIQTSKKNIYNSLIDGELIFKNKFGNIINLFACFDVYFIKNEDRRHLNLVSSGEDMQNNVLSRLEYLERFVQVLRKDISKNYPNVVFDIVMKQFEYGSNIFHSCNKMFQRIKMDFTNTKQMA